MKKILLIEDRSNRRFFLRNLLKIYNYDTYIVSADVMNKMIEDEKPDFVYMSIKEPVTDEDINSQFSNLRADHRLRVRVINTSDHKLKFSRLVSFETFDSFINAINEKILKRIEQLVVRK